MKEAKSTYVSYAFVFSSDVNKWHTGNSKKTRKKKDEDGFIINEVKRHSKGRASNL